MTHLARCSRYLHVLPHSCLFFLHVCLQVLHWRFCLFLAAASLSSPAPPRMPGAPWTGAPDHGGPGGEAHSRHLRELCSAGCP